MVDITLLEVHLDGAEFTANAPGIDDAEGTSPLPVGDDATEGSDDGGGLGPVLVGVLLLAVAVAVGRRVVGGSGEPLE